MLVQRVQTLNVKLMEQRCAARTYNTNFNKITKNFMLVQVDQVLNTVME